jgi:uncharacterized protein (TIGR02118 family)
MEGEKAGSVIRVTALYLNGDGARFDHSYYRSVHLPLAERLMRPLGLLWVEGDVPLPRPDGRRSTLLAQTHAYFATEEQSRAAIAAVIPQLAADVSNYTNVTPRLECHEVLAIKPGEH